LWDFGKDCSVSKNLFLKLISWLIRISLHISRCIYSNLNAFFPFSTAQLINCCTFPAWMWRKFRVKDKVRRRREKGKCQTVIEDNCSISDNDSILI
jgi:hypothetical protein